MGIWDKVKEVHKKNQEVMKEFVTSPIINKQDARNKIVEAVNQLSLVEANIGKQPELDNAREQLSKLA